MKSLYSTKAGTYPILMQQVALQKIREARLRGRPAHPYAWGAFVATGEWEDRPMIHVLLYRLYCGMFHGVCMEDLFRLCLTR